MNTYTANKKTLKYFTIVLMLILVGNWFGTFAFGNLQSLSELGIADDLEKTTDSKIVVPFSSAPHSPIVIKNNISSFSDKTGLGTKTEPFIIENLQITSLMNFGGSDTALWIENTAEYLIIRNIIIENIVDTVGSTLLMYIRNSSQVVLENIVVRNCDISSSVNYICYIRELENITVSGLSVSNYTDSWILAFEVYNCKKALFENVFITDVSCQGLYGIEISRGTSLIADRFTFSNITADSSSILLKVDDCENTTVSNSRFENINVGSLTSNLIRGSNNTFSNNIFHNITATNALNLFYLQELDTTYFSSNLIDSLTSLDDDISVFYFYDDVTNNFFFNNKISNLNADEGVSYCLYGTAGGNNNILWHNHFLSGSIIAIDNGINQYYNLFYFEDFKISNPIGNYWWDHQLDADSGFHFIVGFPREIDGAGNLNDPYPIHYFAMDFDDDNLNNYEEFQHNTDAWDADSDDDGLSDGDEVNIYGTNPIIVDTDGDGLSDYIDPKPLVPNTNLINDLTTFFSNPTNLLLCGVILLLIVNIFVSRKNSGTKQPLKESRAL